MMKRALVLISMVGLGFLFAWGASEDTSQQKAELENLKTELQQLKPNIQKAENEKSALEAEIAVEQQKSEQLEQKVDELNGSRDMLKKQVEKLTFTCEQSRQQLEEIIKVRDKLKQRITELAESRDELRKQLTELTNSRNQLERQVDELTRFRDAAAAKAYTAQDRVDILLARADNETKGINGLKKQNEMSITNQAKKETQPPVIKVSEDPNVLTAINWPAVVSSEADESKLKRDEVVKHVAINDKTDDRPICQSFNTTRSRIMPGQTSILSWQVSDAESVRIEPGVGAVSALGSRAVRPAATTTYTLIAGNNAGLSRLSCRVEVSERITTFSTDSIHPQALLEEYNAPDDSKVLPELKIQSKDPNTTLGKFLGYRAKRDESGKFIFIPVFEKKQEE
jgi:prefoldin subunit 5